MTEISPGRMITKKYRIDHEIARGGMGSLWLGFDVTLNRRVVVKFIRTFAARDRQTRARFQREAEAAAQIRSAHVIETYDYGVDSGCAFIVMEHLEGEDLGRRLDRMGRMPLEYVATLLVQVGKALDAVHAAGIVHRDLKPGNIFLATVSGEEVVKVLDFGIAKLAVGTAQPLTETGALLGTPKYMSPEQIRSAKDLDHRTDLWSVAVIIYRALSGRVPFVGVSATELIHRITHSLFPRISDVAPELPVELDAFFTRALAVDRASRFQSGREISAAFLSVMGTHGIAPLAVPASTRSPFVLGSADPAGTIRFAWPAERSPYSTPRLQRSAPDPAASTNHALSAADHSDQTTQTAPQAQSALDAVTSPALPKQRNALR